MLRSLYYDLKSSFKFQTRNNISFWCLYCILLVRQFVIFLVSHGSDENGLTLYHIEILMPYLLCNVSVVFEELKFEHWSPISTQDETNKRQVHHWKRATVPDLNLNSRCQLSSMSSCQSYLFSVSTSKVFEARSMLFAHGKLDLWTDGQ